MRTEQSKFNLLLKDVRILISSILKLIKYIKLSVIIIKIIQNVIMLSVVMMSVAESH